jgi:DNA repair exonuclease SbcCD nuclease subunit
MIVISDLHTKLKEPFYSSIKQFLTHIADTYPDQEILQLGDFFDSSTVHSNVLYEIIEIVKRYKKLHIVQGNHSVSRRMGSLLEPLKHYSNIRVYDNLTEIEIENHKCLMVPWIYNSKEEYEKIEWEGDYAFFHVTNEEDSFGNEGINTDKIKAYQIFGHTHTKRMVINNKVSKYIMGVNIPTKNLEISNPYMMIDSEKNIACIEPPRYFSYQTLNYGEFPENKDNILNITGAPSFTSVFEMYKGYNVRKEGIEILRTENEEQIENNTFELGTMIEKFSIYSNNRKLPKEVHDCSIKYLQEAI